MSRKRFSTSSGGGVAGPSHHPLRFGFSSTQGRRPSMEDAHCLIDIPMLPGGGFFGGVFDGHGGSEVAKLCAKMLWPMLWDELQKGIDADSTLGEQRTEMVAEWPPRLDNPLNDLIGQVLDDIFLRMDRWLVERVSNSPRPGRRNDSGCTASTVLITRDHLVFANLGDSRALLCRSSKVAFSTQDHKPSLPAERRRIKDAGGFVLGGRVCGCLAVARAVGDLGFKQRPGIAAEHQPVCAKPDVTFVDRNVEKDDWLLIACVGVFDVMKNDEVCSWINSRLPEAKSVEQLLQDLVAHCLELGSTDNMTAVLVLLNHQLNTHFAQLQTQHAEDEDECDSGGNCGDGDGGSRRPLLQRAQTMMVTQADCVQLTDSSDDNSDC